MAIKRLSSRILMSRLSCDVFGACEDTLSLDEDAASARNCWRKQFLSESGHQALGLTPPYSGA
jgi:hypothetical protein